MLAHQLRSRGVHQIPVIYPAQLLEIEPMQHKFPGFIRARMLIDQDQQPDEPMLMKLRLKQFGRLIQGQRPEGFRDHALIRHAQPQHLIAFTILTGACAKEALQKLRTRRIAHCCYFALDCSGCKQCLRGFFDDHRTPLF
jgi:hypothetical protein